jgi:hypothetical protein
MSTFCADGCLTGMSQYEQTKLFRRIRHFLGEPVMQVELEDEQIEDAICMAIEEYSSYVNNWVMQNRLGEMLGLPSEIDFTLKYVSNTLYFEKTYAPAYGEQVGLGANSIREVKTGSIILTAGTQDYLLPAEIEVDQIMWFTPNFVNLYGLDPFSPNNFAVSEFGASYAGQTWTSVLPVFDTILTAQAAQLRNRVRGSEYSYILRGGPNGQRLLKLLPVPYPNNSINTGVFAGTPGTVFYTYYDKTSMYSGNTANPGFTGYTQEQINTGFQGNGLVATPADVQLNFISYSQLNSVAQSWVKRYTLALCKEMLGIGIRGKFNGQLPIPGAELTLNKDDLIQTGRDDRDKLITELKEQLAELSYDKIMEKRAAIQEAINKSLGYGPSGIYVF